MSTMNPPRADVVIDERITIPGWIVTLADYRRWAESDGYPHRGWVAYLNGVIWADPGFEELLSHNQVKGAFYGMFGGLTAQNQMGCFVPDRMFFANEAANLATEPDGLFYYWTTMQSGRLRLIEGDAGYTQLEGTPDAVLEVVSDGSKKKDLVTLRELYWKAQIPEYWLVDARKDDIRFDILRHTATGYEETPRQAGWLRSEILDRSFRIERTTDPLGLAQFVVHVR